MIRRKSDLLIKRRALKKWFTIFLGTNDSIPEHFKRVNAIEKVLIRWFIWLFIWLLSFSDQSSLSDFKAGRCSLDATFYVSITRNLKERTKRLQNDGGNKSKQRWSTDKRIWRFSVLPFFGRWITTTINPFLRYSLHYPLHYNISWEFSYPCCPSQGIFPSPAVQTLVSLSGNDWPVSWYF